MIRFQNFFEGAMPIEKITTRRGSKKVVLVSGKFQPPTSAHKKVVEHAHSKFKVPVVIVAVRASTRDHLVSFEEQKSIFDEMLNVPHIFMEETVGFIGNFVHRLREEDFEPVAIFCGTDRKASYQKTINSYAGRLNWNISVEEIPRTAEDISATKVRESLKSDNFEEFKRMMDPKVWHWYERLRKK